MIKDNIRDYATEAFRLYARLGQPTYELLKEKIYNNALREEHKSEIKSSNISKPTEQAIIKAQQTVDNFKSLLLDVLAVDKTIKIIGQKCNGSDILKTIEIVYFTDSKNELKKGFIHNRVLHASNELYISVPTVYRYLKIARSIFAQERELRNNKIDSSEGSLCDIMLV